MIVAIAEKYLGKREKPNNMGFEDAEFEKRMQEVGFHKGQAWCSYFAELVWKEAGQDVKPFSAGAFQTYLNYEKAGRKGSAVPELGALVVWRSIKNNVPQWTGHIGIVTEVGTDYFRTIEGNTNDEGSREGIKVARKKRKYLWKVSSGLQLVGFINPK